MQEPIRSAVKRLGMLVLFRNILCEMFLLLANLRSSSYILGCEHNPASIVDNASEPPSTQASPIPMNELEGG